MFFFFSWSCPFFIIVFIKGFISAGRRSTCTKANHEHFIIIVENFIRKGMNLSGFVHLNSEIFCILFVRVLFSMSQYCHVHVRARFLYCNSIFLFIYFFNVTLITYLHVNVNGNKNMRSRLEQGN